LNKFLHTCSILLLACLFSKVSANSDESLKGYSSYLFVYFTGNNSPEEAIRFALSPDGLNYRALNNNQPVIASDTIARMSAVRDPHILRCQDGKTFYMVVTDMKSANGWDSNHGMVLLKSTDLVNWKHTAIDIAEIFPKFSKVTRVWAPQTIFDPKVGKYMIYWSMRAGKDPDVIYYSYVNDDFTALTTEPKVLYDNPLGTSCIDGDIIYENGVYNLFFKTESIGKGIKKAESANLTGPYEVRYDKYLQVSTNPVEGACVFRLINSDRYMLIYDVYTSGKYEFTESTDLKNFKLVNDVTMNFAPRHGTIIPITTEEAERLARKWGKTDDLLVITAEAPAVKHNNIVVDNTAKTVFLPVRNGTDLSSFEPKLATLPGASVTPAGPCDFTNGPVNYKLSLNADSVNYAVTAQINRNPVLDGYYADPEILYSEKTGLFYLYPTSDGFPGWSGTFFKVFSSSDLVNWKDEGVIIDLAGSDVSWAKSNAWAPCIVEKKINGKYRYFYYFCAGKKVGVAVSNSPTGPFVDSGKALIDFKPSGVSRGQEIDPDVFTDPKTGKSYLYWGNGYMAGVELNKDMVSINYETMKVMTPDTTFREATYVIYRDGKYYFMWSQDDTGSPDYRVRYAFSDSPLGNLTIPSNNLVIARDDSKAIYGTGHNSVVRIPGKDEWYIVYHRLTRPKGITLPSPGFYREVCIDRLEFNIDGSIKKVQPTLEGIAPVSVSKRK
jgi:arabinoxylan arabinofuranohydrolase